MGWEIRARGRAAGYFYRSERQAGRPVKIYVGTGPVAESAVQTLRQRQQARQQQHTVAAAIWRAHMAQLEQLLGWARWLVTAHLLLGGYYVHHGSWRPRGRHPGGECGPTPANPTLD